jgi:hypothetical protein
MRRTSNTAKPNNGKQEEYVCDRYINRLGVGKLTFKKVYQVIGDERIELQGTKVFGDMKRNLFLIRYNKELTNDSQIDSYVVHKEEGLYDKLKIEIKKAVDAEKNRFDQHQQMYNTVTSHEKWDEYISLWRKKLSLERPGPLQVEDTVEDREEAINDIVDRWEIIHFGQKIASIRKPIRAQYSGEKLHEKMVELEEQIEEEKKKIIEYNNQIKFIEAVQKRLDSLLGESAPIPENRDQMKEVLQVAESCQKELTDYKQKKLEIETWFKSPRLFSLKDDSVFEKTIGHHLKELSGQSIALRNQLMLLNYRFSDITDVKERIMHLYERYDDHNKTIIDDQSLNDAKNRTEQYLSRYQEIIQFLEQQLLETFPNPPERKPWKDEIQKPRVENHDVRKIKTLFAKKFKLEHMPQIKHLVLIREASKFVVRDLLVYRIYVNSKPLLIVFGTLDTDSMYMEKIHPYYGKEDIEDELEEFRRRIEMQQSGEAVSSEEDETDDLEEEHH